MYFVLILFITNPMLPAASLIYITTSIVLQVVQVSTHAVLFCLKTLITGIIIIYQDEHCS